MTSVHPDSVPKAGGSLGIHGVEYTPRFLDDADALLAWALTEVPWDDRIKARKTASFGEPYEYAGLTYRRAAFPPPLEAVRARVAAHVGLPVNNCLLNLYPDGRSRMGFHADSEEGIVPGTGVAIVSLGATRNLRFRRTLQPDERLDYVLEAGSLLVMPAAVQELWQHSIARGRTRDPRVSLTFRQLEPRGAIGVR